MRLAGCGLHWAIQNLVVYLNLGLDQAWNHSFDIRGKTGEESIYNCGVDHAYRSVRHISVWDNVKMTLETLCNNGTTTSRWTHSWTDDYVNNCEPWLFFVITIIPSSKVHKLTKKFDWRLCTVLFLLWHVKIINKNDVFLAKRWAPAVLSSLFEVRLEIVLSLVCRGLCWETHE